MPHSVPVAIKAQFFQQFRNSQENENKELAYGSCSISGFKRNSGETLAMFLELTPKDADARAATGEEMSLFCIFDGDD
jgi:hypothetical protein